MSKNLEIDDLSDIYKTVERDIITSLDIYINSYYSFLYLKKNSFYDTLKSVSDQNQVDIRIIVVCKDNDQNNSVMDFFLHLKNTSTSNIIYDSPVHEKFITIIINKQLVFLFKVTYDEIKKRLSCNLVDQVIREPSFFSNIFNFLWYMTNKNENLDRRSTFQQDFIEIASHQLRNPIVPILGFSKTLKSKISDPLLLDYLDIIIRNGEKLRNIANDILDVSRIETQSLIINKENFDIDDLLSGIVKENQLLLNKESICIRFTYYGTKNLMIQSDKSLLSQSFSNILNSCYYSTKNNGGQEIIISLSEKDDSVVVTVEDERSEISSKDLNLLFTKFYAKSSGGTGLGLFISKKLIEIVGGNISVENRCHDLGIKFIIDLPKSYDIPFYESKDSTTFSNNHILLISDFSKDVTMIKEKIIQLGYTFDYFEDPLDAIDHFLPKKYFLVFLGIDIKGLDGFDLFNELKKRDNLIKGYFIASNKINREAIDEFFRKDILDQFIYKPLSPHIIENIIKKEIKN